MWYNAAVIQLRSYSTNTAFGLNIGDVDARCLDDIKSTQSGRRSDTFCVTTSAVPEGRRDQPSGPYLPASRVLVGLMRERDVNEDQLQTLIDGNSIMISHTPRCTRRPRGRRKCGYTRTPRATYPGFKRVAFSYKASE